MPIIDKLFAQMKRALANAEVGKQIESLGMVPSGSTPHAQPPGGLRI